MTKNKHTHNNYMLIEEITTTVLLYKYSLVLFDTIKCHCGGVQTNVWINHYIKEIPIAHIGVCYGTPDRILHNKSFMIMPIQT